MEVGYSMREPTEWKSVRRGIDDNEADEGREWTVKEWNSY